MNDTDLLMIAMAKQCRTIIEASEDTRPDLPQTLRPRHLLWMTDCVTEHAEDWPGSRLHRWIGFIQCGMLANGILDFDAAKAMFDAAKKTHSESCPDDDLIDHLDPENAFTFDIGGEG